MKKAVRIYEMAQGEAKNIQVIEKVTLVVHSIDERTNRVTFTVNPNLTEYQESPKKQSIGYESISDTRQGNMTPTDPPFPITIDGTRYEIAVDSIGTTQDTWRWAYCDFVISWGE